MPRAKAETVKANGDFSTPDPPTFTLDTGAGEPAPPPPATDRIADEMLARDEERKSKARERVRRYREREKEKEVSEAKPSLIATPEEVRETAMMFDFMWHLAVMPAAKGRLRALNEKQAMRGGEVFAPLVKKYLPMIADWQLEVTALMFVAAVVKECHVEVQPDAPAGTGGQPDTGGGGPQGVGEINARS